MFFTNHLYNSVEYADLLRDLPRRTVCKLVKQTIVKCERRGEHGNVCREVPKAACAGPEHVGWELEA